MLEQNSSVPLYEQLKDLIARDIRSGRYGEGYRMPSEMEIENEYKVSRITVRRAISELCEEGLLVKKQGKGTFVVGKEFNADMGRLSGFHEYMEEQGRNVGICMLERSIVRLVPSLAKEMELAEDDDVFHMRRIMSTDGVPIMVDSCYIPLKLFPGIAEKFHDNDSVFRILRNDYGVEMGKYKKVLKVRKASKEVASYLDCSVGDPVFDMFKLTYDRAGVPVHLSISLVKGEGTSYKIAGTVDNEMTHNGISWSC